MSYQEEIDRVQVKFAELVERLSRIETPGNCARLKALNLELNNHLSGAAADEELHWRKVTPILERVLKERGLA